MKKIFNLISALLIVATLGLATSCQNAPAETPQSTTDSVAQLNISTIGIIDFEAMTEDVQNGFKGGEGDVAFRIFKDDMNKVMRVRMTPHSSVGQHSHETDSEIIIVLQGSGKIVFDGQELPIRQGQVHYCPKGHGHTIINDTDQELHLCCVVPQQ
ncbi:MAG: cupin domain-containing protein [Bacteroidales bacterium]|nr:cupin domain-containing protein [Bacteroidales bacterium]MCQ2295295.1 cupin domain-containing protein [Bacteroidales bacterium]